MTDASGGVTHSYAYDPYGVTTETTSPAVANPWRYTGQHQDVSTGLYKMGARYYQPELGRWTQPDQSGLEGNAYLYAAGNPVNSLIPLGLARSSPTRTVAALGVAFPNDSHRLSRMLGAFAAGAGVHSELLPAAWSDVSAASA